MAMAKFHDLVESMRVGTASDSIYDDLTREFNDRDAYAQSADAKIAELDGAVGNSLEEVAGRDAEISRLKAINYDLMSSKASEDTTSGDEGDGGDDSDDDGIDGMFEGDEQ
jgi:hypothetical protein